MANPSDGIDLPSIWLLLQEMQKQVLSLQELIETIVNHVLKSEGTLSSIQRVTQAIDKWRAVLKGNPHTPPPAEAGTEATPPSAKKVPELKLMQMLKSPN